MKKIILPFIFIFFSLIAAATATQTVEKKLEVTGYDKQKITIKNDLKRIVALNPSTTEILFKLGQGSKVVGTDIGVQYPPEAVKLAKVGHPYRPSVEGIISLKPDLVISTQDSLPEASVLQIRSAKIPVLILEPSDKGGTDGYKNRVSAIAEALDVKEKGQTEIKRFEDAIKKIQDKVKADKNNNPLKVFFFYAHGPASGRIYGNKTGPHYLIELAGAKNAADFIDGVKDFTSEAMVKMSPDVIIVLKRVSKGMGGPEGILKMPGVSLTPAGKNKAIIEIDDSVRWIGPRYSEWISELYDSLKKVKKD